MMDADVEQGDQLEHSTYRETLQKANTHKKTVK